MCNSSWASGSFLLSSPCMKSVVLFFFATTSALLAQNLPSGTKVLRDVAYVTDGHERQRLDLYLPEDGKKPMPLLIWIHGGGWQSGSKAGCPFLRQGYLQKGYAVASLDYRLTGDAPFPAQIEDCKAAIRWLRAHAGEYGINPDAFGVGGSSAGGHLVALVGTAGEVKAFDVGENLDQSSAVQAVYDLFGPTDLIQFGQTPGYESHARADSPEGKLLGGAPAERVKQATRANPITHITPDDPPYFIVHGDADPTVPIQQSELLHAALVKAGIPSRFTTIKGGGHGKGFPGEPLAALAAEFFDRHLKGSTEGTPWPAAMTSEMEAVEMPEGAGRPAAGNRPKISFDVVLKREDANGDGQVSREEFKGPPFLFGRLDANGDGVLTRSEFEGGR